ncbi:hypothetical protein M3Y99_01247400 [Aphelenchoides fujianensis]|nr:hypothetical protein M3Y99_01247400 [Aphelenchoides fujianensis]
MLADLPVLSSRSKRNPLLQLVDTSLLLVWDKLTHTTTSAMADGADELMTDEDFEQALELLCDDFADPETKRAVAMMANEAHIISWEEAEQMLCDEDTPIKSSLPQQTRPTEPDNDTNVDDSIRRLQQNDPKLVKVNLNNMKRTPVPQIKRIIEAIGQNEHIEMLSLANMGLYDLDVEPLIRVLELNESLRVLNLETNYLSGEFFARLFEAALKNQTLEEVKAVNQGVNFSTVSEKQIIKAIFANRGLLKVSFNFRLPEGRFKVDKAIMRNNEIRRVLRRQATEEARKAAEGSAPPAAKKPPVVAVPPPPPEPPKEKKPPVIIKTAPSLLRTAGAALESKPPEEPPKVEPEKPKVAAEPPPPLPKAPVEPPKPKEAPKPKEVPKWRRKYEQPPPADVKPAAMKPMILAHPPPASPTKPTEASTSKEADGAKKAEKVDDALPRRSRLQPNASPSATSATATSQSESEVAPGASPRPKKRIVKKKKKLPTPTETNEKPSDEPKSELNGKPAELKVDEKPRLEKQSAVVVDEQPDTPRPGATAPVDLAAAIAGTKPVEQPAEPKAKAKLEAAPPSTAESASDSNVLDEKPAAPKKRIVKKKKKLPTPEGKRPDGAVDGETPKVAPNPQPKPLRSNDEPIGVFPRSRLGGASAKS